MFESHHTSILYAQKCQIKIKTYQNWKTYKSTDCGQWNNEETGHSCIWETDICNTWTFLILKLSCTMLHLIMYSYDQYTIQYSIHLWCSKCMGAQFLWFLSYDNNDTFIDNFDINDGLYEFLHQYSCGGVSATIQQVQDIIKSKNCLQLKDKKKFIFTNKK